MKAPACLRNVGPTTARLKSMPEITRSRWALSVLQWTSAFKVRAVSPSSSTVCGA